MTLLLLLLSMNWDAKWLAYFEQQFLAVADGNLQIGLDKFKQALHLREVQ